MQRSRQRMWLLGLLIGLCGACGGSAAGTASGAASSADGWAATDLPANPPAGHDAAAGSDGAGSIEAVACVAPGKGACDLSSECGSDQYCDPCLRTCLAVRDVCAPCSADIQCKLAVVDGQAGSACLAYPSGSFCGLACLGAAGCPQGYSCETVAGVASKQCVPKTKSCAPGSGSCKADSDCPYTLVCNATYGVCVKGCTADAMCASGTVCSLGHCVPPCSGDAECKALASAAVCTDQRCKVPGGCLASEECETKATYCDLASHTCKPGCKADADCKDFAQKCEAGQCVTKGCAKNWECPFGHICDTTSGQCKAATGLYCAPCDPNDQEVKACGGKPNACFSMQDGKGDDKGAFCGIACGSEPGGPCPQGYQCQDIKDDKGNSQGKVCIRPCYVQPVAAGGG